MAEKSATVWHFEQQIFDLYNENNSLRETAAFLRYQLDELCSSNNLQATQINLLQAKLESREADLENLKQQFSAFQHHGNYEHSKESQKPGEEYSEVDELRKKLAAVLIAMQNVILQNMDRENNFRKKISKLESTVWYQKQQIDSCISIKAAKSWSDIVDEDSLKDLDAADSDQDNCIDMECPDVLSDASLYNADRGDGFTQIIHNLAKPCEREVSSKSPTIVNRKSPPSKRPELFNSSFYNTAVVPQVLEQLGRAYLRHRNSVAEYSDN